MACQGRKEDEDFKEKDKREKKKRKKRGGRRSETGKRFSGMSTADFLLHLLYYIILHAFIWCFSCFHLLLGYFIALFSLPSSPSIQFKGKPGFYLSYATDHGARLCRHEMGSYDCLFVLLFWEVLSLRLFISVSFLFFLFFFPGTSIFVLQHACGDHVSLSRRPCLRPH